MHRQPWDRLLLITFLVTCLSMAILSAELTKNALLQTVFWRFCPMGFSNLVIFSWEIHSFIKTVKTKESHLTYDNQRGLG